MLANLLPAAIGALCGVGFDKGRIEGRLWLVIVAVAVMTLMVLYVSLVTLTAVDTGVAQRYPQALAFLWGGPGVFGLVLLYRAHMRHLNRTKTSD